MQGVVGIALHEFAGHLTQVCHRQRVQVVHQPGELQNFFAQAGHQLGCGLTCTVLDRFKFTAQYRQWRAKFMGDFSDPVAARRLQRRQRHRHGIDIQHQLLDFNRPRPRGRGVAGHSRLHGQVAACDTPGGQLQLAQRPAPAAGHPPGCEQRGGNGRQRSKSQAGVLPLQKARVQPLGLGLGEGLNRGHVNTVELHRAHAGVGAGRALSAGKAIALGVPYQHPLGQAAA